MASLETLQTALENLQAEYASTQDPEHKAYLAQKITEYRRQIFMAANKARGF